jgi:hypothetical protein
LSGLEMDDFSAGSFYFEQNGGMAY